MSAEVLRRAAALMRGRALGAVPLPWFVDNDNHLALPMLHMPFAADSLAVKYPSSSAPKFYETAGADDATTHHLASWHPAVALAVADWLDATADYWTVTEWGRHVLDTRKAALVVARAYLGDPEPPTVA